MTLAARGLVAGTALEFCKPDIHAAAYNSCVFVNLCASSSMNDSNVHEKRPKATDSICPNQSGMIDGCNR